MASRRARDLRVGSIVAVVGDGGGGSSSCDVFGKLQEQMSHHVTMFINRSSFIDILHHSVFVPSRELGYPN